MPILSAPQVVFMTTCGATSDDKVGIMTTLGFQWNSYLMKSQDHLDHEENPSRDFYYKDETILS